MGQRDSCRMNAFGQIAPARDQHFNLTTPCKHCIVRCLPRHRRKAMNADKRSRYGGGAGIAHLLTAIKTSPIDPHFCLCENQY